MLWIAAAGLALLIWTYLLLFHGGYWRIPLLPLSAPPASKKVVAIIPARNEADVIAAAVGSLAPLPVVLVDDNSTDGTADAARASHVTVIHGAPLPPGWTGKLWAVSQGVTEALKQQPDYLLVTDADIRHHPPALNALIAAAESEQLDLASYMVRLTTETFAEKALIPAFVYFFLQLYPPRWTNGAAGGCILIRPQALEKIGGYAAIRNQIIDDCALSGAVKRSGGRVRMWLTADTVSLRPYAGFAEMGRMISRSAFNQLQHSSALLLGAVLGMLLLYVVPIGALCSGNRPAATLGLGAWLLMSITYLPMIRFYRLPLFWAALLPPVALFYLGATIHSALQYWRGKGGLWKGRVQDA